MFTPIGAALGGADISYFVSFIVAGVTYLCTMRAVSTEPQPSAGVSREQIEPDVHKAKSRVTEETFDRDSVHDEEA